MKKTDIAMIILIASISVGIAYVVVSSIPAFQASNKPVMVKTADKIDPTVSDPDPDVFNDDAINPTVPVTIGDNDSDNDSE